jgi:uncharacterized membrane protein
MQPQEASIVVPRPLADVELQLRRVEDWPQFVDSVAGVEQVAHERYRFDVVDAVDPGASREVPVAVRVDGVRHVLRWESLAGARYAGSFTLEPIDADHTSVRLSLVHYPDRAMAAFLEMLLPRAEHPAADLAHLDRFLTEH